MQSQQQQQDAVWSTDIISFKEAAQKIPNLKSSISGIAVNGTGLPIISGAEFAERSANLLSVQNLEEKERDRRIAADSSFSRMEKSASLNATRSMEEAERSRRMKDIDGSEEYRELLAHKVTGSISGDVLTGPSKLRRIALDALGTARQAGQGVLDTASGFAQRAVTFFGQKVASGVASINENLHDFSDKAMEKAQELGGQASGKATELTDRAFDKVQDFTGKAVQQAQSLKEHATTTAQDAGERVVHFGTQKYGDALRLIAIGKLDFAEETERQYRTTIGLSLEKFLLALKTSELIRNYWSEKGQYNAEFSSWYGTGIIEEFERRRRVQHDRSHTSSQDNAKKISQLIHLRNIQTQSYRPQLKQIEKVSEVIGKKAEEIRSVPTRAMAAM